MEPPRLELTPLLDVMFLLLTFFIFAFVLMVRLEVTDIRLPAAGVGTPTERVPALTVGIGQEGELTLAGEPTTLDSLPAEIDRRLTEQPGAQLLIAVDERAPAGEVFKLMDALRAAGRTDLRFLRAPTEASGGTPAP